MASVEKPKKPRSQAQIDAFERARARRAERILDPNASGGEATSDGKFKGKCNYCKRRGHKEQDCFKKKRAKKTKEKDMKDTYSVSRNSENDTNKASKHKDRRTISDRTNTCNWRTH